MADINKNINIGVDTSSAEASLSKLSNKLDGVSTGNTKITKSTTELGKAQRVTLQSVLANGGAMGTLSGILGQSAMAFKDATEAVQLTGVSLKGLKGAIIATGIGALVVVIGELVGNWDKWVGLIDGSTKKLKELNEQRRQLGLETERTIQQQEQEIKLLEINGASSRRILQEKYANVTELIASQKIALEQAEKDVNLTNKSAEAIKTRNDEKTKLIGLENQLVTLSAEFDKLGRDKKEEQIAKSLKSREEAQRKADEELKKNIESLKKYGGIIENIELQTKKFADIDLSSSYVQVRNLTDAYFENRKALEEVLRIQKAIKYETDSEVNLRVKIAKENERNILKEIELIKERAERDQEAKQVEINNGIELKGLEASRIDIELKNIDAFLEGIKNKTEAQEDYLAKYQLEIEILRKRNQMDLDNNETQKTTLKDRLANIETTIDYIRLEERTALKYYDIISKKEEERDDFEKMFLRSRTEEDIKGYEERLKVYFDYVDKKRDLDNQITILDSEEQAIRTQNDINIANVGSEALLEAKQRTADAMLAIDESYAQASQTAYSNLYGFINVLQDENLIKSKGIRDALLLLEKGMAIAGVWIEEAKSSAQVKANMLAVPPVIGAAPNPLYGYAQGVGLKSIAMNKVGAGIATATILAQTIASFKSGGSSGGGGGGAAAYNPPAQFNMVGNSGQNQLAKTIGESQNRPVNAYVVSSDVSTALELERNKITNSTFI